MVRVVIGNDRGQIRTEQKVCKFLAISCSCALWILLAVSSTILLFEFMRFLFIHMTEQEKGRTAVRDFFNLSNHSLVLCCFLGFMRR